MAGGGVDGGATAAARDRAWQPAGRRYSTRTRWIELNRDVIIDLWNQAITPDVAIASCKSCRNRRERDRGSLHHRATVCWRRSQTNTAPRLMRSAAAKPPTIAPVQSPRPLLGWHRTATTLRYRRAVTVLAAAALVGSFDHITLPQPIDRQGVRQFAKILELRHEARARGPTVSMRTDLRLSTSQRRCSGHSSETQTRSREW